MTKAVNGDGSIYFLPGKGTATYRKAKGEPLLTGTWYASITVDGKRVKRKAQTRAEAVAKINEVKVAAGLGLPVGDAVRVGEFCTWFLTTLEATAASNKGSVNTLDNAAWAIDHWIIPSPIGGKRLRELTPEDVEALLEQMVAKGLSRSSVGRVKFWLGRALAKAMVRGKVSRNVAKIAEMPATPEPTPKSALTMDEAKKVMAAAVGNRLEALFVMAIFLGMRPGELTGLLWEWVDLTAGTLNIQYARKYERDLKSDKRKKVMKLGAPKTETSRRPLALPAQVLAALEEHQSRQRLEAMSTPSWVDTGLVFTTEVGTAIGPAVLRLAVRRMCEKAEVPVVTPNELGRHTAATLLYDSGMPMERIADLLGHKSTRMLEQTYRDKNKVPVSVHVGPMEKMFGTPASS